jgi:hypothetical protein
MALPSIATPQFSTTVPSTGQEIEYRPFLVKEEKVLMMAMEGGDNKEIATATKNILKDCILSDVDIKKLTIFDIEFLFLKLRAKSVGETIELKVAHPDENSTCKEMTDVVIDIDDIKVTEQKTDNKIMLTDDIGVVLRYPGIDDVDGLGESPEQMFSMIANCIEYVFDKENVFNEFTEKEMVEWIENLKQTQFSKITDFFSEIPKLSHDIEWTCKECGKKDKVTLEGLQSFFM